MQEYNITKWRIAKSHILHTIICLIAGFTAIPLIAIIVKVVISGIKGFSWTFLTETTPSALKILHGEQGGIFAGIIGSGMMILFACLISIPIGILSGIYLSEEKHSKLAKTISYMTDLLQGTPSIIIGIVVYAIIVIPFGGYSGFAGGIALSIMMLPLIARSTEESLKIVPETLKEASLALGSNRFRTVFKVQIPCAFGGIFTGILLAISRVLGETAPLMFTALGSSALRFDMTKPMSSVPLMIWEFWTNPNLQELVWSASLFLLTIVLTLNMIVLFLRKGENK